MGIGVMAVWFGPEPDDIGVPPASIKEAVLDPFSEFFSRPGAWALLR